MTATVKKQTALPFRNDTILGVCEALGQEFGINPTWLRLAFVAPLFFQPVLTIVVYFALGAIIATSRYFYPRASVEVHAAEPAAAIPAAEHPEDYKIAA